MGLFTSCFTPLRPTRTRARVDDDAKDQEKTPWDAPPPLADTTRSESRAKLTRLRAALTEHKLDAYVIPTADAHSSEYVGECDKRRAWISGFNGSAGVAIVTLDSAHLFTDSRYWVQAAKQLDLDNWTLEKVGADKVKTWDAWLLDLPRDSRVGVDPSLLDYGTGKSLRSNLDKSSISLVFPAENLVDLVWGDDRPPRSASTIELHPLKFAGRTAQDKLEAVRAYLSGAKSEHETGQQSPSSYLVTTLSPIAWLLNLRGNDVDFNPVFFAHVLVDVNGGFTIWVQDAAVTKQVRDEIERLGGKVSKYEDVLVDLKNVKGRIVTDSKVNMAIVQAVGEERIEIVKSPVEAAQAIKNSTELQGLRNAYLRDGVAWARWAAWLEDEIEKNKQAVTEWDAAEKLTQYRMENEHYAGLAYENISATGENAALPHYAPSRSHPVPISLETPYLNDSGANYRDGTIDTTRTVHFGRRPTKAQRRAFTRVLQGHIAIDKVVFPEGTTGAMIDVLARSPLWSEGMNYNHGTGHGVGSYLSVHETQVGISGSSLAYFNTPFVPGHCTSNEPAYYETGSFGIRLESVLGVREVDTRRGFGDKKWLGFERFTTVPIQTKMVDFSILSRDETEWLKRHNATCVEKLSPFVQHDKRTMRWLKRQ